MRRGPIPDLRPLVVPLDAHEGDGTEHLVRVRGIDHGQLQRLARVARRVGTRDERPRVLLGVVVGHHRPALDVRVLAGGGDRGDVRRAPRAQRHDAIAGSRL
jgi:hypothetical protein